MSRSVLAVLAVAIPLALATPALHAQHAHTPTAARSAAAPAAPKLQAALRDLWHGHVVHAREYALAVQAGDAAGARKADAAVVTNARRIADAVAGFYGPAGGRTMLELLGGHWSAVKRITDATHAGDPAARTKAIADMTTNARAIANFLAGANPHLSADAVFGLLAGHGGHHVAQVDQLAKGDRKAEAATWTAMQKHMDTIADALASAIARQFPAKAA